MGFVGRENELQMLERLFAQDGTTFVPVYGRRRVGKSELIKQFIVGKPALYALGKQAPAGLQLQEFMEQVAEFTGKSFLAEVEPKGWKQAFELLLEHHPPERKLVLVLDEFQWMAEASVELPSVLQGFLDNEWRDSGNVMLILCGSYIGFMEREVLGSRSPLFGRRSGQILLKPFSFGESTLFHPEKSLEDQARIYFICGGVPLYLQQFVPGLPIGSVIQDTILASHGPLHREPDFLLREELREVGNYYAILQALASSAQSPTDVTRATGLSSNKIPHYWKQLKELGYVTRHTPLSSRSSKLVRYELDDPMLRFWFRFVYPRQSYIEKAGPKESYQALIVPHLDQYFGYAFERLCRESLADIYVRQGLATAFEIGTYWDKQVQVDVVGIREKEGIDLGECKWGSVKSTKQLVQEIESKVPLFPNPHNLTITKRVFTRKPLSQTTALPAGIIAHHLEELK